MPDLGLGSSGSRASHCASVRSVGYGFLLMPPTVNNRRTGFKTRCEAVRLGPYRVLTLEALTRMELTDFRANACVNVRDLIDVELIDATWVAKLPPELGARLQEMLDNPEG